MQNSSSCSGQYNIYPGFSLEEGVIAAGYVALAECIAHHPMVIIDGYGGVNWQACHEFLNQALIERGVRARWIDVQSALSGGFCPSPEACLGRKRHYCTPI